MIRRKRYSISVFTLTALAVATACNAGTYTPNDLIQGRLPSNDANIVIQTMDANWNKEIYLPAYPSNGDVVSFVANATYTSRLVGNLLGFGSLEMHTKDKLDVVFDAHLSAWRLKNESSPNTVGNHIPNDKRYVSYYVADANWNSLLHLPSQKGQASKILVRSQALYDTYVDNSMLGNMGANLKIKQGEYYVFTWNDAKAKWDVIDAQNPSVDSKRDSIRDLTFFDISVDTSINGTGLYNNGRMQKPIEIRYRACLTEDADIDEDSCSSVDITQEEAQYYLHLGRYGRNDAGRPEYLVEDDEIFVDYEKDPRYQSSLPGKNGKETLPTDEKTLTARGLRSTTFWLRYKAKFLGEEKTLNVCAFQRWQDENGDFINNVDTQDCNQNGTGSSSRRISIIDGSYKGSMNNNPDIVKEMTLVDGVCKNESDCHGRPGWRIFNGWARGISYADANLFKYSSRRPNHSFIPVENAKSTTLARGCVRDASGGSDSKDDGICTRVVEDGFAGVSFYTTDLQFGSAKTMPISYSTEDADKPGFVPGDRDTWQFDTDAIDTDRAGTFSVFSVLPVIDFRKGDTHRFVIWTRPDGGHWSASTQQVSKKISSVIEDNYGNRFRFNATLYAEPNMGATNSVSKDYVLSRMKDETLEPILD
ncbi:hypothetical protein [Vibrio azureus]|uniref:Metalloprotease StcE beta-sandwich domain-containing protein n=2 Tax=Vibrio azureus TaxID=512649 RepID=U3CCD0_9VIBR|nr:hypothetical protein [Vibrio azureus]GAD76018.1 hypothetical protein VAZ01S_035_00250 [Vibrio azureus NBRC 104587]